MDHFLCIMCLKYNGILVIFLLFYSFSLKYREKVHISAVRIVVFHFERIE